MRTIQVKVINAFSIDGTGGNPAGVVLNADALSIEDKQSIAKAAAFPETAFVSASEKAGFKLDFFTPEKQIPHCGHATIAAMSFLKATGRIDGDQSSKETIDGIRSIQFLNGEAFMEQTAPRYVLPDNMGEILLSIGLHQNDLAEGLQPVIVNTGNSFLVVPVKDEATLAAVNYNRDCVKQLSNKYGLIGFYLFAMQRNSRYDATTRMFAPYYGIDEEAATGMAAGPLACYLHRYCGLDKKDMEIEQGRFMKPASPSKIKIRLTLENGSIEGLFAGGNAYVSDELMIEF